MQTKKYVFGSIKFSEIDEPTVRTTMVKLTQIDESDAATFEKVDAVETKPEAYESDASDSDSDIEDDDIENETIYDRVVALKDIIDPVQRQQILSSFEVAKSYASAAFNKSGNLLWTLTSSVLILGVPLSLAILSETQLQEMEKEMSLQQSAQDVLAPGSEAAFDQKVAA